VAAPRALDKGVSNRAFAIGQVRQGVSIGPADFARGRADGAGRVDGAEKLDAAVAESKPPRGVQPDLVSHAKPM
jgi:hypothetical protein